VAKRKDLYVAVDLGGTKIQASLVERSGVIVARTKQPTPRHGGAEAVLIALEGAIQTLLDERPQVSSGEVAAIGVGVPGVVDPKKGLIVVTPNMGFANCKLRSRLRKAFGVPVAVGNDCNLGALGEKWLGSARRATSAMVILVGTGIGGGFVQKSRVWRGARETASEIGHVVMQIHGPRCGCGNHGCLEALASRSAIERQLREAVAAGRSTVLTELLSSQLDVIRSGVLRQALELGDELVTEVVRRAAEVLGYACLSVRHLLDPEVIVLGGGVIEACGRFMMPIVQQIVETDRLPGARDGGHVFVSALGDDAVVLGAAALAQMHVGLDPLRPKRPPVPDYPKIIRGGSGKLQVADRTYSQGLYVTVGARVKSLKGALAAEPDGRVQIAPEHLLKPCRGGPEVLFIGIGRAVQFDLSADAAEFLRRRAIQWQTMPLDEAVAAFNGSKKRRAAILCAS